jgi:hypothetical protein
VAILLEKLTLGRQLTQPVAREDAGAASPLRLDLAASRLWCSGRRSILSCRVVL